jgi:Spy/CpxP family protein refolding chaperone
MRRCVWMLLLLAPGPVGLRAQAPGDSGARPNSAETEQLRAQIRQRWNSHLRATLGLTDEQAAKLEDTERRHEAERQPIRARQRAIGQVLDAELASGSPNQDRVTQLMNERQQNRLALQEIDRREDGEMQRYLTPVQRARYQEERRRFQERVRDLVQQRRQQRQPREPGQARPPRPPARKRPRP